MWKQLLERRGIAIDALPKKVKNTIAEYQEIEQGIVELRDELAQETNSDVKSEIESDIAELERSLSATDSEIYNAVMTLKVNPDGTVGNMTASEITEAWNSRKAQYEAGQKQHKTKSIF